jgi:BirA family biotin operon repressor/biotin-[acetyl-CoA-carboxylase] ligase
MPSIPCWLIDVSEKAQGNAKDEKMKKTIIHLKETDSTNRLLRDHADDGSTDIVVATADYQTAGRGQGTNTWESEAGKNLLFSIKVRPEKVPIRMQFMLSMTEALAVKEALDSYTEGITLKWPNDVYWHDRKISGTLIETTLAHQHISSCIFGTGINVNQTTFVSDAPNPVSLAQILGHEVAVDEVLQRVLTAFEKYYELLDEGDYGDISALYHLALYRRKGYHQYRDADGSFEGAIVEVEDDGHLILHDRQGVMRSYLFKEVEFVL